MLAGVAQSHSRPETDRVPFLRLVGLTKVFGGVRAVDKVDLEVPSGAMACIIGPNGCGKTTLFNLITGYLKPTAGAVHFCGRRISGLPLHEIARRGIVRKFQVPSVFPALSVAQNLRVAGARPLGGMDQSAALKTLLETIGLDGQQDVVAGTLSHGRKQWLELAMMLASRSRLILLDEPAAGMTRAEKTETVRMIHALRMQTGISLLVIEHDMSFVEALDCPVTVMIMGRVVTSGTLAEVRKDARVRDAYLGQAEPEPAHA